MGSRLFREAAAHFRRRQPETRPRRSICRCRRTGSATQSSATWSRSPSTCVPRKSWSANTRWTRLTRRMPRRPVERTGDLPGPSGASDDAAFVSLQRRLRAFEPTAETEERTVVAAHLENFPGETLERHARDLPALEERWLYFLLALRWPRVRVVVVTSLPVRDGDHRLLPRADPASRRSAVTDDAA